MFLLLNLSFIHSFIHSSYFNRKTLSAKINSIQANMYLNVKKVASLLAFREKDANFVGIPSVSFWRRYCGTYQISKGISLAPLHQNRIPRGFFLRFLYMQLLFMLTFHRSRPSFYVILVDSAWRQLLFILQHKSSFHDLPSQSLGRKGMEWSVEWWVRFPPDFLSFAVMIMLYVSCASFWVEPRAFLAF